MTTPWIDAKGIHTFYGSSHILHGIDFTVGQGETIGLMGRNGMGKSTLLKSLMGLVKPRAGSVAVAGRDMTGKPPYEVARLGIAYVPEGRGIFGNLSVVENLQMAARAGTRGQREWTYERVLETFPRLQERLGHGGQQLAQMRDVVVAEDALGTVEALDPLDQRGVVQLVGEHRRTAPGQRRRDGEVGEVAGGKGQGAGKAGEGGDFLFLRFMRRQVCCPGGSAASIGLGLRP